MEYEYVAYKKYKYESVGILKERLIEKCIRDLETYNEDFKSTLTGMNGMRPTITQLIRDRYRILGNINKYEENQIKSLYCSKVIRNGRIFYDPKLDIIEEVCSLENKYFYYNNPAINEENNDLPKLITSPEDVEYMIKNEKGRFFIDNRSRNIIIKMYHEFEKKGDILIIKPYAITQW